MKQDRAKEKIRAHENHVDMIRLQRENDKARLVSENEENQQAAEVSIKKSLGSKFDLKIVMIC